MPEPDPQGVRVAELSVDWTDEQISGYQARRARLVRGHEMGGSVKKQHDQVCERTLA
jgi:hypothetical protein